MSGLAKRQYRKYISKFVSSLMLPFRQVANLMRPDFTDDDYVRAFRMCYPHLWQDIEIKYLKYKGDDERLIRRGKKRRYKFPKPRNFIIYKAQNHISKVRELHHGQKEITIDEETIKTTIERLHDESIKKIESRRKKEEQKQRLIQNVRPSYTGYLLGKYLRYRRTHSEDVNTSYMLLQEASKYKCKETIDLFQKVNATERNYYLRLFAFQTLQRFGIKEVKLRKNPKGKVRPGDKDKPKEMESPKDLLNAIYNTQLEQHKRFDVFLSHSSKDVDALLRIKTMLNVLGINVYIDWVNDRTALRRERTNEETAKVITERIKASKSMLYVQTDASSNSQWAPWELGYAHALGKKICVLQVGEVQVSPAYIDIYDKVIIQEDKLVVLNSEEGTPFVDYLSD